MFRKNEIPELMNDNFFRRHPVFSNIIIIFIVAFLGLWIAYLSLKLFTKHGSYNQVPAVENMSYTQAIETLHSNGFRVDIRDSLYNDDYKPGFVIEQFPSPGSKVKPGRKIFLYINAVHPREAVIDVVNLPREDALKGISYRQGMARLEELGFKNVTVKWVPGDNDRIIRLTRDGKVIKKLEKVPVTAPLVLEVYDGKQMPLIDSLQMEEYMNSMVQPESGYSDYGDQDNDYYIEEEGEPAFVQ